MSNLEKFTTKDLVEELSKREGVQRIDIAPHTETVEIAHWNGLKFVFDEIFDGPQIVLRIED